MVGGQRPTPAGGGLHRQYFPKGAGGGAERTAAWEELDRPQRRAPLWLPASLAGALATAPALGNSGSLGAGSSPLPLNTGETQTMFPTAPLFCPPAYMLMTKNGLQTHDIKYCINCKYQYIHKPNSVNRDLNKQGLIFLPNQP